MSGPQLLLANGSCQERNLAECMRFLLTTRGLGLQGPKLLQRGSLATFHWTGLVQCDKCIQKFCAEPQNFRSRDSVVGIATGYGLDNRGVRVRVRQGQEFSLLHVVRTGSGAHPTSIQWVPGALSPGVMQQGREADHLAPTSVEVKKM
jgi:hypothetical protein